MLHFQQTMLSDRIRCLLRPARDANANGVCLSFKTQVVVARGQSIEVQQVVFELEVLETVVCIGVSTAFQQRELGSSWFVARAQVGNRQRFTCRGVQTGGIVDRISSGAPAVLSALWASSCY